MCERVRFGIDSISKNSRERGEGREESSRAKIKLAREARKHRR